MDLMKNHLSTMRLNNARNLAPVQVLVIHS